MRLLGAGRRELLVLRVCFFIDGNVKLGSIVSTHVGQRAPQRQCVNENMCRALYLLVCQVCLPSTALEVQRMGPGLTWHHPDATLVGTRNDVIGCSGALADAIYSTVTTQLDVLHAGEGHDVVQVWFSATVWAVAGHLP